MTSPKEARPPVKKALKLAPPEASLTALAHHVHSTKPNKGQVELLATPGSHAQTAPSRRRSLVSEPARINTNAVPQPFLDASLLEKE